MSPDSLPAVARRFLRYVRIDTQSDRGSETTPSTVRQKDLGRLLAEELHALGLADAVLDEHGYVYARLGAGRNAREGTHNQGAATAGPSGRPAWTAGVPLRPGPAGHPETTGVA